MVLKKKKQSLSFHVISFFTTKTDYQNMLEKKWLHFQTQKKKTLVMSSTPRFILVFSSSLYFLC